MDARCTGCGGCVMPYREYVIHFRPSAVCRSCGRRVRLRHFRAVVLAFLAVGAGCAFLVLAVTPAVLALAGLALAALSCLLADFWTFRNLPWDPDDSAAP